MRRGVERDKRGTLPLKYRLSSNSFDSPTPLSSIAGDSIENDSKSSNSVDLVRTQSGNEGRTLGVR